MKKDRRKIIIVILIALVLIGAGIWFWWFLSTNNQQTTDDSPSRNLFPFGQITPGTGFGDGDTQGTIDEEGGETNDQETIDEVEQDVGPQLRLITETPTAAMIPLIRVEEKEITVPGVDEEGNQTQEVSTIDVENHFIRYSSIEDGSVYETRVTGDNPWTEEAIVENFIPNAQKAVFSNNGAHVAFQYWDNDNRVIESYLGLIEPVKPEVLACPFDFTGPIEIGEQNESIFDIHQFLNREVTTQIARSGVNSPGNESALVSEATVQAIETFQTVHGLEVDGLLGPQTRGEMLRVCNEQQEEIAEAEVEKLDTKYEISGFFLPQDIISVNMDPNNEEVFYLEKEENGVAGTLRNFASGERSTIFTSPHTQWTSTWQNSDYLELTTKPSYASLGYSYELNVQDGDFHKSFKQRNGLQVLPSHDNTKLLVHDVDTGRPQVSIYDREGNRFIPLSIETFVDKCVWSRDDRYIYCGVPDSLAYGEEYPDVWYQGLETYSDSLWRIDTTTNQEVVLSDIGIEYGQEIDIEYISVDSKDEYVYFIDKKTEALWSYRLDTL